MGLCDNPDKILRKENKQRKKPTRKGTGKNAGPRHRGKPKMEERVIDWVRNQPEDLITTPVPGTLIEVSSTTEEMWDTHGYIQNWYNPMIQEHYKHGGKPLEPLIDADGELLSFGTTTPSLRRSVRNTIPFLSNEDLDELALKSEAELTSVVDTNVSIANFIIELIELCEGNVRGIGRFQKIYEKAVSAFRREFARLLKAGHKRSAAYWLAWNFAIKPAISDLRAILCSISSAYKKMKWLQDHNHTVVFLDYHRDLTDKLQYDPDEWYPGDTIASVLKAEPPGPPYNGLMRYEIKYSVPTLKYHARSKIYLDIPEKYLQGAYGMSVLWGAMQGLHNPIGIIWEAIPFSWLIDYFLSYRARLFQQLYDYNPYNEGVKVLGFGHSFVLHTSFYARLANATYNIEMQDLQWGRYRLKTREHGLPYPEQASLFRVPSDWYHISILGAVGAGIHPGRRR